MNSSVDRSGPLTRRRLEVGPLPAVLLASFSVQCGAAIAKRLFVLAGPLWTVTLRIVFSALILAAVFRPRLWRLRREQWLAAIPFGVFLGAMNLMFYLALARIPLGIAVALEFSGPLLVAVVASKRVLDVLWAALAICGILLLTPWSTSRNVTLSGVLFALGAGLLWAIYIVLGRRVSRVFGGSEGVAVGMIAAALAIIPFAFIFPASIRFDVRVLLAAFGVAALSSALPYALEMIALRKMPARTFGILMSLEPAIGAGCGWALLHEKLHALQIFAIALVIGASVGTTLGGRAAAESHVEV